MKRIVSTPNAPAAIGPYSQAVEAGGFLFVSGQIAIDPATGQVVEGGIEAQTQRVLANVRAILEAGGSSIERVVRTTIYLRSMADFATVNGIYGTVFSERPPARATVEVSRLPKDVLVEIDAIAIVGE